MDLNGVGYVAFSACYKKSCIFDILEDNVKNSPASLASGYL